MALIAVVGWGNPDRRDDGAGWVIVERLRQAMKGVCDMEYHVDRLLTPEAAELLQDKEHVLFVDAEVGGEGVSLRALAPADEFRIDLTHHLPPGHLLALSLVLYDRAPRASLLTVQAFDISLGEGLTDECAALIDDAVSAAQRWALSHEASGSRPRIAMRRQCDRWEGSVLSAPGLCANRALFGML